jgi:phospholipid/cholesterol/gamma-HCH transport system ATP-binding protein
MLQDGMVYKEGKLSEFENSDDELINSYFKSQNITNTKNI